MNLNTIKFQQEAIDRIYKISLDFLSQEQREDGEYKIIFRSPTGSGKTVMASKILEKIALDSEEKVSFVWVSKGILAEQSKRSFEKYVGGGGITFSFLEDILDNEIKENEILFTNWEKIFTKARVDNLNKDIKAGDWTNKFMRENEWDRNLKTFCENTRNAGRKIILVIDESQLYITENTVLIMEEIIKPYLRIDITATPKRNIAYDFGDRDGEYITLDQVKAEEVIKKEVVINADIEKEYLEKSEKDGDLIVFEKAIEKRDELLELYKKEKSEIKPLVLVQLPNEKEKLSATDKEKIDWVEEFLDRKYGVNYENGKLAKWLSGDKSEEVEDIADFNSPVEFLIFKQAIATGWDCPRAQILIKFRQTRSETFEIQTVGRIMRSPEFKWYENEQLNRAYVYANLTKIDIEENAFEYIKTEVAKRKKEYEDLDLYSIYSQRGEYNDLKYEYRKYFFEEFFKKIGGKNELDKSDFNFKKLSRYKATNGDKLNLEVDKLTEGIILDEAVEDIDKETHIKAKENIETRISDFEIERAFLKFLKSNTGSYQQARSYDKIRVAIYQVFEKFLEMGIQLPAYNPNIDKVNKSDFQKVVLANKWFFREVIETSIKIYSKNRDKTEKTIREDQKWNVTKEEFYSKNFVKGNYQNSIMSPSYFSDKWKTEVGFMENYLEQDEKIEWWYKNGENNKIYFGVLYEQGGKKRTFYPDFIVKYKNGKVGIFDTKKGKTAKEEETVLKANALSKYIEKWNKKGKNLFGGIVVPIDEENTEFKLNENKKHNYIDDGNGEWTSRF